jgi:hypothetical protein
VNDVADFKLRRCPHIGCQWSFMTLTTSVASMGIYDLAFAGHIKDAHDNLVPDTPSGINWNELFGGAAL